MRRLAFATVLVLLFAAAPAGAAGVNLRWNECGYAGTMLRTFACDTDTGVNDMVASFDPPAGLTDVNGAIGIIDLCLGGVPLAPWWQFSNQGGCRPTSLTALAMDVGGGGQCADYWQGLAFTTVDYQVGYQGWDSARIVVSVALTQPATGPVEPGTEYHAFTVRIRNTNTIGCGGCNWAACIVLNEIRLVQPAGTPGGNPAITNPRDGNHIWWQASPQGCPFIVPVRNQTWGAVKSLYR